MTMRNTSHWRLALALLLFVTFSYTFVISRFMPAYITGNAVLLKCLQDHLIGESKTELCSEKQTVLQQQDTVSYLLTLNDWKNEEYEKLAANCPDGVCACDYETSGSKRDLHERMKRYYSVLSYQIQNGEFPRIETCQENLPTSHYIWNQSIRTKDQDLAEVLWELAYLVDNNWRDAWQRGQVAYRQATRYRNDAHTQSAEHAFEMAIEAFLASNDARGLSYISWSLTALGEIAFDRGDLDLAKTRFRQSIANSPEAGDKSFHGLIRIWRENGLTIEDISNEIKEIRHDLGSTDPHLTSGPASALVAAKELEAAWGIILSAPLGVQQMAPVLVVSGEIHERRQEFLEAENAYLLAIAQTLEDEPLQAAIAANNLSRVYESQEKIKEAIRQMEFATELNPKAKWYWYRLALLYQEENESRKARQAMEQALQLDPQNQTFLAALATLSQ